MRRFEGHTDTVTSVAFSPDGRHVLTSSTDSHTRIFDVVSGALLASLISFRDGTWAVVDAEGRFDAANGGDVIGLHWAVGLETIALSQLKDRYYHPNLLARILGRNAEPLRDVRGFNERGVDLYPRVQVSPLTGERIRIELTDQGGGIGRVRVLVNGKELTDDARHGTIPRTASKAVLEVDLADHPSLKPGDNLIEIRAYNAEGYLVSRGLETSYRASERAVASPTFWAVIAGVSDYQGTALDLQFAAKDAEDFARALELGALRLFGATRTRIAVLSTSPGRQPPTKVNLAAALYELRNAEPVDIVVVYLAGHGVTHGGAEGDFYFLTSEAASGTLTNPTVRQVTAISSAELSSPLLHAGALKQVLILDTCHAGRVVEKLTDTRAVPESQARALERMKDRTGMYVLAGSAADAVSYEASRFGQGLLTYSLLLGMRGAALRADEYVDVSTLLNFAADQVPDMARGIGGIQRPLVAKPRSGASFNLGRLTGEDKARVPLTPERPLVLRANFQDERRIIDHLGLSRLVNDRLRDVAARGQQAPLAFVDAQELPDAWLIAGRYSVDGNAVSVQMRLFRGEKAAGEVTVTGEAVNLPRLADAIVSAAQQRLK